jgi:magnesium transporter
MITDHLLHIDNLSWVDVQEPHYEDFERLNSELNLPYLLVQDCLRPEHLPKYECTDDGHFLMLRSFDEDSDRDSISVQDLTRKIALFITDGRLVTIHRVNLNYIDKISEKAKKPEGTKNLHSLIHQIIIAVIRSYEAPINALQDLYDDFEDDVLSKSENLSTTRIYHFRRRIFVLKRMLKQTNDSLYRFRDYWEEYPSMLQDLRENIDQLYFHLDEISDNFEHLFELYISLTSQKANEVMKVLTVFSTILLPLNFVASFYGMNFEYLPGLHSPVAFYFLIGLMALLVFGAIWYFRKRGWFQTIRD